MPYRIDSACSPALKQPALQHGGGGVHRRRRRSERAAAGVAADGALYGDGGVAAGAQRVDGVEVLVEAGGAVGEGVVRARGGGGGGGGGRRGRRGEVDGAAEDVAVEDGGGHRGQPRVPVVGVAEEAVEGEEGRPAEGEEGRAVVGVTGGDWIVMRGEDAQEGQGGEPGEGARGL